MQTVAYSRTTQACLCAGILPAMRPFHVQHPLPPRHACRARPWTPRRGVPTQLLQPHGAVSTSQSNGVSSTASAAPASTPEGSTQGSGQGPPSQQPSPSSTASSSSSSQQPTPAMESITASNTGFQLKPIHMLMFTLIFVGGALFATMTLQFTAGMEFTTAVTTVLRRVARSVAFRQLVVIACAVLLLRYGLNNFMMALSKFSSSPVQWDKTKLFYILREVYQPLELLLFIAAVCTVADAYAPALIGVPRSTVSHVMKSILSTSFILGFASVVFNLKSRFCKENAWQAEMKGDITTQRRWEAYDKLGTFVIYVMSFVLGVQALGLEVTSVLAIGGIGGLAIGLAGREICENLLNGFLIMSTNPFEVGDEITFFHNNKVVEGFVIDIGWYRTNVRSFEREVFVIPNAVFSKNIVLNVSRKNREWRFYETLCLRVQDVPKANAIVQDIRRIMRNDTRVINKLHRRVFLDKITPDDARIYMSFYLEAANRDAFMAIKQDLLVSFVDCVERNGAKLATPRTVVDMDPEVADVMNNVAPMLQGLSAYAMAQNLQQQQQQQQQQAAAGGVQGGQLALPATITTEATTVSTSSPVATSSTVSTSSTSVSAGAAADKPAAATAASTPGPTSNVSSSSGASGGVAAPVAATAAAAAGPVVVGSNGKVLGVNGSGAGISGSSPAPAAVPSSSSAASSGSGSSSSGAPEKSTKVGEVFTAPQSTVVVSVPASGVPVAFAGSVSNNVVSSGVLTTPPSSSSNGSNSRASPSSSAAGSGGGQGGQSGNGSQANAATQTQAGGQQQGVLSSHPESLTPTQQVPVHPLPHTPAPLQSSPAAAAAGAGSSQLTSTSVSDTSTTTPSSSHNNPTSTTSASANIRSAAAATTARPTASAAGAAPRRSSSSSPEPRMAADAAGPVSHIPGSTGATTTAGGSGGSGGGASPNRPVKEALKEAQLYLQQGLAAATGAAARGAAGGAAGAGGGGGGARLKGHPPPELVTASQVITPSAANQSQAGGVQQAAQQQRPGQTTTDVIMASFDDLPQ